MMSNDASSAAPSSRDSAARLVASPLYNPWLQRLLLAGLILYIYWDGLWGGAPRADQIAYLHQVGRFDSLGELLRASIDWNRTQSPGDYVLFRPLLYIVLASEYYFFRYDFWAWQFTSLSIHIATTLGLHALFWRGALKGTMWPLLLALWFGTSYLAAELVLWNHIVGYVVFGGLRVYSLLFLVRFLRDDDIRFAVGALILSLLSNLTYETGIVLDIILAPTCFLLAQKRRRVFISVGFLFSAAIPIALNILDGHLLSGHLLNASGPGLAAKFPLAIWYSVASVAFWVGGWVLPTLYHVQLGGRAEFVGFDTFVETANQICAALVLLWALAALPTLWRARPRSWQNASFLFLVCALSLGAYAGVISVGRLITAANAWTELSINIYYAYLAQLIIAVSIAILSMAWRSSAELNMGSERRLPFGTTSQSIGSRRESRLIQYRVARGIAAALSLLGIVFLNARETARLATGFRYQFSAPRNASIAVMLKWLNAHRNDGAFYVISDTCVDEKVTWFADHFRRGSGWHSDVTFLEALFPERSAHLNKDKVAVSGAPVEQVNCAATKMGPETISGRWRVRGGFGTINIVQNTMLISNEHGMTASATIKDNTIIVPDWNVKGVLSSDGSVLSWNNGTNWSR